MALVWNDCLTRGIYPNPLKIARVTPIFKAGERTNPGNYRPISVLSDINKIFETLIYRRLLLFLNNKSILSRCQYGFRVGISTQKTCIDVVSLLLQAIKRKEHAICLFIDFKKAFDSIDHQLLLLKLEKYGIRGNVLELFSSYLSNREQYVSVNGASSGSLPVSIGIPQGSTLGPILFNIFVNDIPYSHEDNLHTYQWADDTAFVSLNNNLEYLIQNLNAHMQIFYNWCENNKMNLNFNKTKAMLVSYRTMPDHIPNVNIHGVEIEYVNEYKYLGLLIDNKLKFSRHMNMINNRLSKIVGTAYSLRDTLNLSAAKTFYYTMFFSILSYCIAIWGGSSKTSINDLQITQNKIVRILFGDKIIHRHTSDLYKSLQLLNVSQIYKLELGKIMFNIVNNNKYTRLKSELNKLQWSHNFNTRKINVYRLPSVRTTVDQRAVLFSSVSAWNQLHFDIRCSSSLHNYKKK